MSFLFSSIFITERMLPLDINSAVFAISLSFNAAKLIKINQCTFLLKELKVFALNHCPRCIDHFENFKTAQIYHDQILQKNVAFIIKMSF